MIKKYSDKQMQAYRLIWILFLWAIFIPSLIIGANYNRLGAEELFYTIRYAIPLPDVLSAPIAMLLWPIASIVPESATIFGNLSLFFVPMVGYLGLYAVAVFIDPPFYRKMKLAQKEPSVRDILAGHVE